MADASFSQLASCNIGGVPVLKYRSSRTGIVVCIAQVEGPIVNGFFCLGLYCKSRSHLARLFSCPLICLFIVNWLGNNKLLLLFVATEAHDDDGLPHTLEHLVFMGSELYPYKVNES